MLRSCVRIPLEARMSVWGSSLCVLSCVGCGMASGLTDNPSKIFPHPPLRIHSCSFIPMENWPAGRIRTARWNGGIVFEPNQLTTTPWRPKGSGCIGTSWPWMVSFTPRPLWPKGNSTRYHLDRRFGAQHSQSERCEELIILDPTGTPTPIAVVLAPVPTELPVEKSIMILVIRTWNLSMWCQNCW
jgi:hypothetical protein